MTTHSKTYLSLISWVLCTLIFLWPNTSNLLNHYLVFIFPLTLLVLLLFSMKSIKLLPKTPLKSSFFLTGACVIVISSLSDVLITFWMSPTLSQEGNPIIIKMLDQNYTLNFVKSYIVFIQFLFTSVMLAFWVISCKSMPQITQSLNKASFLRLIPQILAGKDKTYKDLILSTLDPYYANASIGAIFIGVCFVKLYCSLEWLRIVPISRVYAPSILLLSAIFLYCLSIKMQVSARER